MKEFFSSLTSKGQVTVPKEIRQLLGLEPDDKVMFVVDGDQVRLARGGRVVTRTAGSLKSSRPALSAGELRAAAEEAIAAEAAERVKK